METRTLKGLKRAERLQANGWQVISASIAGALLMEKSKQAKANQLRTNIIADAFLKQLLSEIPE